MKNKKSFDSGLLDAIIATDEQEEQHSQNGAAPQHPNAGKLQPEYQRYTLIVRKDLVEQLKSYAWTERKSVKEITETMFTEFLKDKKIIER